MFYKTDDWNWFKALVKILPGSRNVVLFFTRLVKICSNYRMVMGGFTNLIDEDIRVPHVNEHKAKKKINTNFIMATLLFLLHCFNISCYVCRGVLTLGP